MPTLASTNTRHRHKSHPAGSLASKLETPKSIYRRSPNASSQVMTKTTSAVSRSEHLLADGGEFKLLSNQATPNNDCLMPGQSATKKPHITKPEKLSKSQLFRKHSLINLCIRALFCSHSSSGAFELGNHFSRMVHYLHPPQRGRCRRENADRTTLFAFPRQCARTDFCWPCWSLTSM